jgi:hypothetical protein
MSDATASSIATDFDLGPIDQISFAVTSVEQSLTWYEAVFGGPFAAGFEVIFGGTTPCGSLFAYVQAPASLGRTVIELIQQPKE